VFAESPEQAIDRLAAGGRGADMLAVGKPWAVRIVVA
jgi:hypothetical protein